MEEAVRRYFEGKPATFEVFEAVREETEAFGPFEISVASQISFGVNRKFAWFWLYNVTQKNPSGILHTMLRLDERIDDPHVRNVARISTNRWNHQIVLRTLDDARSDWLRGLLGAAYRLGSR